MVLLLISLSWNNNVKLGTLNACACTDVDALSWYVECTKRGLTMIIKLRILTLFSRHNFIYSGGAQSNFHYCMMPRAQIWKFSFHSATVCGLAAFYIKYDRVMWSVRRNLHNKKKNLPNDREDQQPRTMTNAQRIDKNSSKNWTNPKKKLNQNHFSLSASACWSILILFYHFMPNRYWR